MVLAKAIFILPNATFFVELASFFVLLLIVAKWVVPPVAGAMSKRQREIAESIAEGERARERLAEADRRYAEALEQARTDARGVIERANQMGEEAREELRQKGQQEYDRVIERAQSEVDQMVRRAENELEQRSVDLAVAISEKLLGAELDPQRHERLIDATITQLASVHGAGPIGTGPGAPGLAGPAESGTGAPGGPSARGRRKRVSRT